MKLNFKKGSIILLLTTLFMCSCSSSQSKLKERFDLEKYSEIKNLDINNFYSNEKYKMYYDLYNYYEKEAYFPLQTIPTLDSDYLTYDEYACATSLYFRDKAPRYMKDHGYNFYPSWSFDLVRIVFYPTISENGCALKFKDAKVSSIVSLQNIVSVIENNGVFGYQMNILDQEYLYAVLSILYNCNDLQYDIYVVDGPRQEGLYADVYFIPQDNKFSKDIVDEFLKIDTCFYFDKEGLKNYKN